MVGNVGRLHRTRTRLPCCAALPPALPRLPQNSLLAILGSGRLERAASGPGQRTGIGERVLFGQVEEARRYFKAFDAFALSSDHEPFGMVLQAMVAGVP